MSAGLLLRKLVQLPDDILLAAGLALFTIVSRLPFCSQVMYHWDCVNFVMALEEFNLSKEQPHPPGYILYVYLGRLANLVVPDRAKALILISVVSSALAVVALFYLGRAIFGRRVGVISALLLASCPLFWFYGEVSLPHPLDAFLITLSAWWLYRVMVGEHRYVIPAAALLAIAGGFRQQTLVMLAPLALFAMRKVKPGRLAVAAAVGGIVCVGWFVPLVQSQGGLKAYLEISEVFSNRFMITTSVLQGGGWWGIRRNLIKLGMYTLYAWNLSLIPGLLYLGLRLWCRSPLRSWNWEKAVFFLLWIVPFGAFYVLVHMGQQGQVFVFLPALLLISAVGLVRLLVRWPRWLIVTVVVLAMANMSVFCLSPEYPLGGDRFRLLTRATLVNSDRYFQDRFTAIEKNFAPESTAILAINWHHVEYYLPQYRGLPFGVVSKWEKGEGNPVGNPRGDVIASPSDWSVQPDAEGRVFVVVFDPALTGFNESPDLTGEVELGNGDTLVYMVLDEGQSFYYGTRAFGVVR
jgi:4-amino-4-deoxy-L-arabinose transferase-like glycosyltransferase